MLQLSLMRFSIFILFLFITLGVSGQVRQKQVTRILRELSADAMQGRYAGTAAADKAADFIAAEFKKAGVTAMSGSDAYLQRFRMMRSKTLTVDVMVDGEKVSSGDVLVLAGKTELNWSAGQVEQQWVDKGQNLAQLIMGTSVAKDRVLFVDTSYRRLVNRLRQFGMQRNEEEGSVAVVLTSRMPNTFTVKASSEVKVTSFQNVVGMIPGKREKEYVIFSGHYDHIGIDKLGGADSIYNGANDDASGTTAVILLARYFARMKEKPERTLLFVAFTAEEIGGYGASYFSRQLPPEQVVAMFNIEMIGTESKWGRNSAYITGYERSDFGKILQGNLEGSGFTFHPDPYPQQNLFFRSDNATLARLGVPAHTISTSKMDSEKFYHTVDDEVETLDLGNMTEIIKSIAISSRSIIDGRHTPSRVSLSTNR